MSRWLFVDVFFFQAEDGIRDLVRSRGLGDVYKRQHQGRAARVGDAGRLRHRPGDVRCPVGRGRDARQPQPWRQGCDARPADCLLYTSDAADERSSVDLGGRRIIKKKEKKNKTKKTKTDQQYKYKNS